MRAATGIRTTIHGPNGIHVLLYVEARLAITRQANARLLGRALHVVMGEV